MHPQFYRPSAFAVAGQSSIGWANMADIVCVLLENASPSTPICLSLEHPKVCPQFSSRNLFICVVLMLCTSFSSPKSHPACSANFDNALRYPLENSSPPNTERSLQKTDGLSARPFPCHGQLLPRSRRLLRKVMKSH